MESNKPDYVNLRRWVRGIFHKGERITKIECRHLQTTDVGSRSHKVLELSEAELKEDPENIASNLIEESVNDAENFEGLQQYILTYYTEKGGDDARGRHVFRIAGKLSKDEYEMVSGSEPPNEKGINSQVMRHNEALIRITLQNVNSQMSFYERRLESQERVLERSAEREIRILELIGNLEDRKLERELEFKRQQRSEMVKDKLLSKVDLFAPILAAKILPSATGGKVEGIDIRLMPLLESLTEEQMHKLFDTLNDEQRASLMEIYTSYREYKKKEEKTNAAE
jgi:hypothetical protein